MELVVLDGGVASAMKNTQYAVIAGVVLLVVVVLLQVLLEVRRRSHVAVGPASEA